MNVIWAPWRKSYILQKPSSKKCFLCDVRLSSRDQKHFILVRTPHSFAVLNLFPYNNGHLMVVPNRHVSSLEKLKDSEAIDLIHLMNEAVQKLRKKMKSQGINIGINLERPAGAGLPGHVHIHVVPRWVGDVNFMPVMSDTKVISESLKSVYQRLKWKSNR
jgi:ATP adenylyltransferase